MREPDDFIYDVRVRDRMMRAGRLTAEGLETRLSSLADCASQAEQIAQDQPALGRPDAGSSALAADSEEELDESNEDAAAEPSP